MKNFVGAERDDAFEANGTTDSKTWGSKGNGEITESEW